MSSISRIDRRLCLAPMMGYTDQHCRVLFHLICPDLLVYTEMLTTAALLHGDHSRLLKHSSLDAPCALQLGGSDPAALSVCAKMAEDRGFQEVNLNIGCPSDRVQLGGIGACLMANPDRVADCIHEMQESVAIPVTVKCRIGLDDQDNYEFLDDFVHRVNQGGCEVFIVHARKAVLQGLSPKENREIPPLRYDHVYRLKKHHPELSIVLNGGLTTPGSIQEPCRMLDGVMIGRAAIKNPMLISMMASTIHHESVMEPREVFTKFLNYASQQIAEGESPLRLTKHLLNLFHGFPGSRHYRRFLSEEIQRTDFSLTRIEQAANLIPKQELAKC